MNKPIIDHTDNPRLHRLYVQYAQEDLQDIAQFLERLSDKSRVNRSILAGIVHEYRAKLLMEEAAYREAAWRILANDLLQQDEPR